MSGGHSGESDGPERSRPDDVFAVLANKHRLEILYALWDVYDPPETTAVPFSDLYDRVDIDDTGNFSYHLDQLVGHFVRRTDSGYELRNTGRKLVRNIRAGTVVEETDLEREPVDRRCVRCGARTVGSYEDERFYLGCPECEGLNLSSTPPGTLTAFRFPAVGLKGRTPTESFRASEIVNGYYAWTMVEGVCPECSCSVDVSVDVCGDHRPRDRDPCPACGNFALGRVYYVCPNCKANWQAPTSIHVAPHPAVIAFYHDHGSESPAPLTDWETLVRRAYREYEEELLSTDPLRIRVHVPVDDAELHVILGEEMDVVDVTEATEHA